MRGRGDDALRGVRLSCLHVRLSLSLCRRGGGCLVLGE